MGTLPFGKTETRSDRRTRGTGEKDVHDAAHALANISPYEDINQRLSWTPMLAITYA